MAMHGGKAIIFTSLPAASVLIMIEALQNRGYKVPLLVCAPAVNSHMTAPQAAEFGPLVSSYITDLGAKPPAVLAVTSIGQTETSFFATDPDLVLSFGFPYRITAKLLKHRASFVNVHTAPLPSLRGPYPHPWPILRPDLHPIEDFCVSFHYMTPTIDAGPIIKEINVGITSEAINSYTGSRLRDHTAAIALSSLDEVLELVESGFEGTEQDANPKIQHGGGRFLTDEERLITPNMSAQEILRLFRAIGQMHWPPMVYFENNLYSVQNISKSKDRFAVESLVEMSERVGSHIKFACPGGPLDLTIRKL